MKERWKKWIWDELPALELKIFDLPLSTLLRRLLSTIIDTSPASLICHCRILSSCTSNPLVPPTSNTAMWNCAKPLNVQTSKHFASLTFFFLMKLLSRFQMHVWEIWKRRCKKEKKKKREEKKKKKVHVKAPISRVF